MLKKGIKVTILELETNISTEYDSIRKAAEDINSYLHSNLRHAKLKSNEGYIKPFKDRYIIKII